MYRVDDAPTSECLVEPNVVEHPNRDFDLTCS